MAELETMGDEAGKESEEIERLALSMPSGILSCSEFPPCGGASLDLENIEELKRKHYQLLPPLQGQLRRELFWILPNGVRLFMRVEEDRRPTAEDDLLTIFTKKYPASWHMAFAASYEFLVSQAENMSKIERRLLTPRPETLFRSLELCPLPKVKVVIMGSGPSADFSGFNPIATGVPFESRAGVPLDKPLQSIFAEIRRDMSVRGETCVRTTSGDLTRWLEQGVLLLDAPMTAVRGSPEEHKDRWDGLITNIIRTICRFHRSGIVFILLGPIAQQFKDKTIGKHLIMITSRPTAYTGRDLFQGSGVFGKANDFLVSKAKTPIAW